MTNIEKLWLEVLPEDTKKVSEAILSATGQISIMDVLSNKKHEKEVTNILQNYFKNKN